MTSFARVVVANIVYPVKKFIQVVIAAVRHTPRQFEINFFTGVAQFRGQDDGDGDGGVSVSGTASLRKFTRKGGTYRFIGERNSGRMVVGFSCSRNNDYRNNRDSHSEILIFSPDSLPNPPKK